MTRRFAIVLLLAAGGGLGLAHHEQPARQDDRAADQGDRAADRAAIHKTFQELRQALGKGDAAAVVAFWTDSGEYMDSDGDVIRGRKALVAAYKEFFARNKGVKVEGKAEALRFLGSDTAVAEGTFTRG